MEGKINCLGAAHLTSSARGHSGPVGRFLLNACHVRPRAPADRDAQTALMDTAPDAHCSNQWHCSDYAATVPDPVSPLSIQLWHR
jgi:hypothetical protein